MKLEVCYVDVNSNHVRRAICEEVIFTSNEDEQVCQLISTNKPAHIVQVKHIAWVRPYAAPKRARAKAGTQ